MNSQTIHLWSWMLNEEVIRKCGEGQMRFQSPVSGLNPMNSNMAKQPEGAVPPPSNPTTALVRRTLHAKPSFVVPG